MAHSDTPCVCVWGGVVVVVVGGGGGGRGVSRLNKLGVVLANC